MASIFRPTYTDKKTGKHRKLRRWYVKYRDAEGLVRRVRGYTDKEATKQLAARLERDAARRQEGMIAPHAEHCRRPLAEHLTDWEAALLAEGATPKHVRQTVACARRVIDGCGFVLMADLSASRVQQYLAGLRERRRAFPPLDGEQAAFTKKELAALLGVKPSAVPSLVRRHRLEATGYGKGRRYPRATAEALCALRSRGRSIKTSNLYLDAIKGFLAWMVQDRRAADNPLAHLSGGNVKLDRRHDRRALPLDELRAVLGAADRSAITFRGLSGPDRHVLYLTACATGFRAEELACLRPESFSLDAEPPVAVLGAAETKNRKGATQPLPPDLAAALRDYLTGRPDGAPLWPGSWWKKGAEMLRIDLDAAGIPYAIEGPDGPLYADFHALRHSYIALLEKSGATLKEAMQLARHSDPKLTMAVYGRAQLHDLGRAVERLPGLTAGPTTEAGTLKATGTADARGSRHVPQHVPAGDAGRGSLRVLESREGQDSKTPAAATPSTCKELRPHATDCDRLSEAPRPGLEPGTNRLTGESALLPRSRRNPSLPATYIILPSFASACGRWFVAASKRGISAEIRGSGLVARKMRGRTAEHGGGAAGPHHYTVTTTLPICWFDSR
jgi:integrase